MLKWNVALLSVKPMAHLLIYFICGQKSRSSTCPLCAMPGRFKHQSHQIWLTDYSSFHYLIRSDRRREAAGPIVWVVEGAPQVSGDRPMRFSPIPPPPPPNNPHPRCYFLSCWRQCQMIVNHWRQRCHTLIDSLHSKFSCLIMPIYNQLKFWSVWFLWTFSP